MLREYGQRKAKLRQQNIHNLSGTGNRWGEYLKLSVTDQLHSINFFPFFFLNYESEYLTINNKARELLKNNSVIVSVPNREIEITKNTTEILKIFATMVWLSPASFSTSGNIEFLTASARKVKDPFWPQQLDWKSHASEFQECSFCERIS